MADTTERELFDRLRKEYRLTENCLIANPGKYEGEPLWVPYFDGFTGDGDPVTHGDFDTSFDDGEYAERFTLTAVDREVLVPMYPELQDESSVVIVTTSDGFTIGKLGSQWDASVKEMKRRKEQT